MNLSKYQTDTQSLRQYGEATPPHVVVPDDAEERLEAAREKWRRLRAGQVVDPPVGPRTGVLRRFQLVAAVGTVVALLISVFLLSRGLGPLALVQFVVPVVALVVAYAASRTPPKLDTPRNALHSFYMSVFLGQYEHATEMLISADRNTLPRFQPTDTGLGKPEGKPLLFKRQREFGFYWWQLVRSQVWPAPTFSLSRVEQTTIAPGLVLLRFRFRVTLGEALWLLLTPVGLIGLVLFFVVRKRYDGEVQKLMVKVGDEWKLFNGEWQGYEELDLSWLDDDDDARLPDDVRTQAP